MNTSKIWIAILAGLSLAATASSAPVSLRATLDHALLDGRGEQTAVLKIALEPRHRTDLYHRAPIDLAIVIDKSSSMSGDRIEIARRAALQAVEALRPGDRVAIVAYNNLVDTVLPLTPIEQLGDANRRIAGIEANGYTAIYAGVKRAAEELRMGEAQTGRASRIILLSDGQANVGPRSTGEFLALGRSLASENIAVSTIGLGLGFNEDLMASLASGSEGNVYFAEHAHQLPSIFDSELNAASSLVARRAIIEIVCPPGFTPIRILGRDGTVSGQRVSLEISQLYAGQEKYALVEIACPAGRADERLTVAQIAARIQMIGSDAELDLQETASAAYAANEEARQQSVNLAVQRDLVANRIALAQEEAIALADAGQPAAAAEGVRNLNVWLETQNTYWKDQQIAAQAEALARQATTLESEGMDTRARKELRSSAYQKRNQQSSK